MVEKVGGSGQEVGGSGREAGGRGPGAGGMTATRATLRRYDRFGITEFIDVNETLSSAPHRAHPPGTEENRRCADG
ncbi:hypothetical protein GCM10010168_09120 [Actinoplanes ianthinogenes]|uniref:Uncharacterized protein n=1 Tax=Actinoplanes ianthinogenes TaxID=122358 RepID=A0ABM7LXL8_9ACTN|nr:hypothetical protein Aiant_47560 [Actinoplanes ianthinogenes]GGQ95797.1 hypothetical protein GCM10010168_09120 [Actinoplanes ianthinogenes]